MLCTERKRRLEVARVAAPLLLLFLLHQLLLTASERQQHMRRCPVGVLISLRQNPVYFLDNLICRTQSRVQMCYNGFAAKLPTVLSPERARARVRREGLRMTQFHKYNSRQVTSDFKRRCCVWVLVYEITIVHQI